jgi:hypothetical protein
MKVLDILRTKILRQTLQLTFIRQLFLSRAQRLLFLSGITLIFYFFASLYFPLWVLLLGPILWGVPHIISSLRYSTRSFNHQQKNKLVIFQFTVWLLVFLYRLCIDLFHLNIFLSEIPFLFEWICLLSSFAFQFYLTPKLNGTFLFSVVCFALLLFATIYFPIQTALTLLISHNFIPLFTWYKSCQNQRDLNTFFIAGFCFVLLSVLIYFGLFDFNPQPTLAFLNWNLTDIFSGFDETLLLRLVSLYAFSQSIHYFIWLKVIPENYQSQEYPPSFRWSFKKLNSDFGTTSVYFLMGLVLLGLLYWVFFEFQTARLIYFSIAAYHGFMELSTLPFLKSNRMTHD